MNINDLPPEERARLLRDIQAYGGDVHATQERQWIRDAYHYTKKVGEEGRETSAEARSVFWIRLLGVLDEVRDHIDGQVNFLGTLEARAGGTSRFLAPLKTLLQSIDSVRGAFTEDELLYIQCRRDVECHPWQYSYRLRLGKKGLREERVVFGRTWKIDEANVALRKLLRRYSVDERAIAPISHLPDERPQP